MKKALAIILAILIFVVGFVFGYITCNLTHGEEHAHITEGEWLSDGENHWKTCSCGEVMETSSHVGGAATYDSKAICEVCGVEYGEVLESPQDDPQLHTHQAKNEWITDGENHWKACECGQEMDKAAHVGGTATTEIRAICEVCGVEYGELAESEEPVHTHKAEGNWKSDDKNHGKVCSCGEIMSKSAHSGGTATTDKKAVCDTCGAEYGDFATPEEPEHIHTADGKWHTDGNNHWKVCSCGEIMSKSAHSGGTSTTEKKAVCSTCGEEYGELAQPVHTHSSTGEWHTDGNNHWKVCSCGEIMSKSSHTGGTATTDKKAVCSVCSTEYGKLVEAPSVSDDDTSISGDSSYGGGEEED